MVETTVRRSETVCASLIARIQQEWWRAVALQRRPSAVNVHDFPDKTLGKAIPYGIYDVGRVCQRRDHNRSRCVRGRSEPQLVSSSAKPRYSAGTVLQITAACGGNDNRARLSKTEL